MQKLVLQLDIHDSMGCKKKAMKMVSSIPGLDSISMDMKEKKLIVIGDMDPVAVVKKLRKNYETKIVSVGPAKEPEKQKEDPPKPAQPEVVQVSDFVRAMQAYNNTYSYPQYYYPTNNDCYVVQSHDENPNGCVIC